MSEHTTETGWASSFWSGCPSFEDAEWQLQDARDADALRDVLAESTASDAKVLRLALAKIVVAGKGRRTYGGGCHCAGKNTCRGHIPETTKIARGALGLPPLPDSPRVLIPPADPKRKKKRKKNG